MVSIGFPTHNSGLRIRKALNALLAQTFKDFELIISDNASTDNTRDICEEYVRRDSRIRYYRQKKDIGIIQNFEFVLSQARGEYFMFAADDDWWNSEFILTLKLALDASPKYGVAMGAIDEVCEDGKPFKHTTFNGGVDVGSMSSSAKFRAVVSKNPPLHFFICGLFRMSFIRKIFWRPMPRVLGPDKVVMCEAAMMTQFCTASNALLKKTVHVVPDRERQSGEYGNILRRRLAYTKYVNAVMLRLLTSPHISLWRKLLFPYEFGFLAWHERRHLLHELFPRLFFVVKGTMRKSS